MLEIKNTRLQNCNKIIERQQKQDSDQLTYTTSIYEGTIMDLNQQLKEKDNQIVKLEKELSSLKDDEQERSKLTLEISELQNIINARDITVAELENSLKSSTEEVPL